MVSLKYLIKQAQKELADLNTEKRKHPAEGWDAYDAWIVYGRQ